MTVDTSILRDGTASAATNANSASSRFSSSPQHCCSRRRQSSYFKLFPYLSDDLKFYILSFVADAPFEGENNNSKLTRSTLTHRLPHVSRKFLQFSNSDLYWKEAMERQCTTKEPRLWREALTRLYNTNRQQQAHQQPQQPHQQQQRHDEEAEIRYSPSDESAHDLIQRTYNALSLPNYKSMYERVVQTYLRFKGPVLCLPGQLVMGQSYSLTLTEPKYHYMMKEVLQNVTVNAHGFVTNGEAILIHANRLPIEPSMPAVLVQVVQCRFVQDNHNNNDNNNNNNNNRIDVTLLPFAHVWLERMWVNPRNRATACLVYAQCLRMGQQVTNDMNHLARQEALAQIMENMAQQFADADDDSVLSSANPSPGQDNNNNGNNNNSEDDDSSESSTSSWSLENDHNEWWDSESSSDDSSDDDSGYY